MKIKTHRDEEITLSDECLVCDWKIEVRSSRWVVMDIWDLWRVLHDERHAEVTQGQQASS